MFRCTVLHCQHDAFQAQLQQPYTPADSWLRVPRPQELGPLVPLEVTVDGRGWDRSSADIAIAGLGWVAIGCKASALDCTPLLAVLN